MKRVGCRRYVHVSAIQQLTADERRRIARVAARVPDLKWSIARIGPEDVMLGKTTSFDRCDHPVLLESVRWNGVTLTRRAWSGDARPIYHRCEQFLDKHHPRYAYFSRLTQKEEREGLLSRRDIGTLGAWKRALWKD
jgi:hypothetical protein